MMPDSAVGHHDAQDRDPFRDAERVGRLAQVVGDQAQHLLGGADHHRQHEQDERQRHRECALLEAERG